MPDQDAITFQPNIPVEVSFTFPTGKLTARGSYYRGTADGRKVFLKPEVEQQIVALGIQPNEPVQITLVERRQGVKKFVDWEVRRPGRNQPSVQQPVPIQAQPVNWEDLASPNPPANGAPPAKENAPSPAHHTAQTKPNGVASSHSNTPAPKITHTELSQYLSAAMISTVDAFRTTAEYAQSKGINVEMHIDLTGELLQRLATSAFIALMDGKVHNLYLVCQASEARVANGGTSWPH